MDIEWGKDGVDGQLHILQARPETVQSRASVNVLRRYKLKGSKGAVLAEGRAIGQKIGAGAVRLLSSIEEMHHEQAGDDLVTDMRTEERRVGKEWLRTIRSRGPPRSKKKKKK